MYAVYKYNAGATTANILADVVAMATGTTDVQTLSASCDKAVSTITASVAVAGWTVHDAAAGTNRQVLKAPAYDSASLFKYIVVDTNTANGIRLGAFESWNATTHTGGNDASGYSLTNPASMFPTINTTTGGYLYLSLTSRKFLVTSLAGGYFGNSTNQPFIAAEFTRWTPWDTPALGYPNFVSGSNFGSYNLSGSLQVPRFKKYDGADFAANAGGNSSYVFTSTPFAAMGGNNSGQLIAYGKILDNNLSFIIPLVPIIVANPYYGYFGGNVSEQSDIWFIPSAAGAQNDEIIINSNTYVIWQVSNTTTSYLTNKIAVRKG